jgi:hypothetical protein
MHILPVIKILLPKENPANDINPTVLFNTGVRLQRHRRLFFVHELPMQDDLLIEVRNLPK